MKTITARYSPYTTATMARQLFTATMAACACALALWQPVQADAIAEQFIPEPLHFHNPLQVSTKVGVQPSFISNTAGMDNEALLQAATDYRKNSMSSSQRALNRQWLEQHYSFSREDDRWEYHYGIDSEDVRLGEKGLSKLFKIGFKTYWNNLRNTRFHGNHVIPDGEGKGRVAPELEYKLRVSDDSVKMVLKYEF